jgi:hypothetical protein
MRDWVLNLNRRVQSESGMGHWRAFESILRSSWYWTKQTCSFSHFRPMSIIVRAVQRIDLTDRIAEM